jgi:AhpC/TSA family
VVRSDNGHPIAASGQDTPRDQSARRWARSVVLVGLLLTGHRAAAQEAKSGDGIALPGRVVDVETGKPVEGARVIVDRSIRGADPRTLPPWAGEETMRTDADGRFRLNVPPEQESERRLTILLRIRHPGFIARKSRRVLLANVIHGRARGEEPFFATVTMEKGVEYSGRVVTPGGRPAAGLPYQFEDWGRGNNPSRHFMDDAEGRTDDDGRILLRMTKSQTLAIHLGPHPSAGARFPYAPYQHLWGTDDPSRNPDVWAPTDLGRIVLTRGVRVSGRLVDTEGKPIAGQTIQADPTRGRDVHLATTEADGSFSLGPLRPANYVIQGEGQHERGSIDPDAPPIRRPIRVIRPVRIYLKENVIPEPLVLHELPTVEVEVRFVDSGGKPSPGGPAILWGAIPNVRNPANPLGARTKGSGLASVINRPEPPDPADPIGWGVQDIPGPDGRIVFAVPTGLLQAMLDAHPFDEDIAYKTQLTPDGPLRHWGGGQLGAIADDRQITIVRYRAPTVVATLKSEDGPVPDDMTVNAGFNIGGGDYGSRFIRQPDGRYRSGGLMPDHEYEISAWQPRGPYISQRLQRINLPEGGSAEVTLMLRKRPAPPAVGQPAPPFSVRTLDGHTVSLADLRGKTVLLHFWAPIFGLPGAPSLKAVHTQFGKDDRFAMISLCLANDPASVTKVIQSAGLSWPNALLRDRGYDPIVVDYGARYPYKSFLIGPDGKLIARDLEGAGLEKAVAEALGRK